MFPRKEYAAFACMYSLSDISLPASVFLMYEARVCLAIFVDKSSALTPGISIVITINASNISRRF